MDSFHEAANKTKMEIRKFKLKKTLEEQRKNESDKIQAAREKLKKRVAERAGNEYVHLDELKYSAGPSFCSNCGRCIK